MQAPPVSPFIQPVASGPARSRRRALLGLVLLALLLHAAFLGGVGGPAADLPTKVDAGGAVNMRLVEPQARDEPAQAAADAETLSAPVAATPRRSPVLVPYAPGEPRTVTAVATASPAATGAIGATAAADRPVADAPPGDLASAGSAAMTAPPPSAIEAQAPDPGASDVTSATPSAPPTSASLPAPAAAATFLAAGENPPPTYRTVLPPPATMRYEVRRGVLRGTGEIRWQRSGDDYALRLEARIAGLTLMTQTSQGTVDADGIAPTRFVDQRARRSAQAVNFRRDSGSITFSGPATAWPLLAGTQDQLSWMLQLAGIVAAEPERASEGARITMVIVGARGDASVRTLRFVGRENAETAGGSVPALKFAVDGRATYDTSYEIWLDPARDYLPAHATQRNAAGESVFDLLLERIDPPT